MGGMEGGDQRNAPVIVKPSPEFRNGTIRPQEALCGDSAKGADEFRPDRLQLRPQEGGAGPDLFGLRSPVFRRSAFDHIADVDLFADEAHGIDDLCQQSAGRADKRSSLPILIESGPLAHENDPGLGVPLPENDGLSSVPQVTPSAVFQRLFDPVQRPFPFGSGRSVFPLPPGLDPAEALRRALQVPDAQSEKEIEIISNRTADFRRSFQEPSTVSGYDPTGRPPHRPSP